jgi:hypothetical protein
MSGSGSEENLSERKELLPVQFGQVGSDLDRVIVVPRQRDGLKFRLFILAGLFQDTGQTIMQRYQSAHAEWLSFFLLCNPFFEPHRHPLEVVIGRIIGIRCSHRHGRSGERPPVRYPLYAAGAGGFCITMFSMIFSRIGMKLVNEPTMSAPAPFSVRVAKAGCKSRVLLASRTMISRPSARPAATVRSRCCP